MKKEPRIECGATGGPGPGGDYNCDGQAHDMTNPILEFQGEFRWLSNFWPVQILSEGRVYPSVENAYQAAKAHPSQRWVFTQCSPGESKRLGRKIKLHADWESQKLHVMRTLVNDKFMVGTELAHRLIATGNVHIEEGNRWGDRYWGVCRGDGLNNLGKLIMERRQFLITNTPPWMLNK